MILALVYGASDFSDIPAPALPSGMDLLYGDRIVLDNHGEPQIPIGITEGIEETSLVTTGPVTLDFYEQGRHKRSALDGKNKLHIKL
ncbi:MAG: hypothetical protein VX834_04830, partial [Myxococcota bacterium]|nr:hypothetical protein [Myxococcota bacterium]